MDRNKRLSSVELLRVFAMFLIVLGHTSWETNWHFSSTFSLSNVFIQSLWIGGKFGVNIFFLITGYFLSTRSKFKVKPLISLWIEVLIVSWLIVIFSLIFSVPGQNTKNILSSLFPISLNSYWFITVYFFLYLLSPVLNKLISIISKREFNYILLLGFIYLFILSSLMGNSTAGSGNTWITGIYIYILGAWIRKYKINSYFYKKRLVIVGILVVLLLMIISVALIDLLQSHNLISSNPLSFGKFIDGNSPFQLVLSFLVFVLFLNIKIKHNIIINKLAGVTLFVYMLHTNYLLKDFIFDYLFHLQSMQDSSFILIYMILTAFIIFSVSTILGLIFDALFLPTKNKLINYFSGLTEKLGNGLKQYL